MHDATPHPVDAWTRLLDRSGAETAFYRSSVTHLDGMGNPVEEIHFGPEGAIERKRTFDPGGKVLEETAYNPDGSVDYRLVYHYNAAGKEMEQILVLSDGKEHGRWVDAYDASGRLGERAWHNREGRVEVAETFVYDKAGRLTGKVRGNVASWTYHYNEDGRLVSTRGGYYSSDEVENEQLEYDAQGRLARLIRFYPTGEARSVTIYRHGNEPS